MYDICEADYAMWCERIVIADCFRELGLQHFANKAIKVPANSEIINNLLAILKNSTNEYVISRLCANGLITQGQGA